MSISSQPVILLAPLCPRSKRTNQNAVSSALHAGSGSASTYFFSEGENNNYCFSELCCAALLRIWG